MLAGIFVANLSIGYWPTLQQWWVEQQPPLYQTPNQALLERIDNETVTKISWSALLPEDDKAILLEYQAKPPESVSDLTEQILRSIQASSDEQYQAAMSSINTVDSFDDSAVAIPGFIVPIEYHSDQSPSLIFIVPYYGACIHFPPPPPNQIIFARLAPGFNNLDMMEAYLLTGVLTQELFEDPLGTSAYALDVAKIDAFISDPDDFRNH